MLRRTFLLAILVSGSAFAAGLPYVKADFDALQKAGKPALVMIHADWCPTCRAQDPIVQDLLRRPEFAAIAPLRVDFDQQKDAVKGFRATTQSTLIVFKGGKEAGRSTGDTNRESIAALLRKVL